MSHLHSILNPESTRRLQQLSLPEDQSSSSVDQRSSSADDEISSTSDEVDELDDENEGNEDDDDDDDDDLQILPPEDVVSEGDEQDCTSGRDGENPLDSHHQRNSTAPKRKLEKHDRKIDLGLHDHKAHADCPDTLACLPDTNERPQHTLPVILRCAILGSLKKRLTIREIYAAMEDKYPFYQSAGQTWKQSVRHHLSLNRLFERQPRPVTDPGFGSYWTVNLEAPPGTKRPRRRGRPNREIGEGSSKKTVPNKAQLPQLHIQTTHVLPQQNLPQQPTLFQFQPQTHPTPPHPPAQQMNGLPSPHSPTPPQHQSALPHQPQPIRQQTLPHQQEHQHSHPMHHQGHPPTSHQQVSQSRQPLSMHQPYSSQQRQLSHHGQSSHQCQSSSPQGQSSHQSQSSHHTQSQNHPQYHSRQPEPLHRYHPPPPPPPLQRGVPSTPSTPLSGRESFLPSSSSETGDGGKITHEEDNGPTVSEDEHESEEEMLPQSRQPSGQSVIQPRSAACCQLPPFSTLEQTRMKQMREEIATLRRTSAEAVSTSIRLSEQLANANLEVSRSREAVRDLEDMLQSEATKRSEAERLKDIEVERRRAAEQTLNGIVSRSPTRPRTGTS